MSGTLPDGWGVGKVEDVADLVRGLTYTKSDATQTPGAGLIPLLRATNIENNCLVHDDLTFVPRQIVNEVQILRKEDILIATSSGSQAVVGKSAFVDDTGDATFGAFCAVLRASAGVRSKYLAFFTQSPEVRELWSTSARGTNINNLKPKAILGTLLPLPPMAEQEKIVEILEEQLARLDAAVKSVQTVREKAAQFRRALLQDAFNGALTNRLEGFQSEVLRGDWTSSTLREVCIGVTKVNPIDLGRDSFKYVDIGAIDSQTNQVRQLNPISVEGAPSRARQLIQCGDTIFSTVRPYLRNIAWIDESLDGEVASTGFCVLRPNPAKVEARFLFYFLMSDFLLGQVLPLQRGVSYPAVRDGDLFGSRITVPPLAEQEAIVKILEGQWSRLDSALLVADEVERKATALRRSLLHAAFSGELTRSWRESNV